jgi:Zn-dependent hydrolases, including glyoxylases
VSQKKSFAIHALELGPMENFIHIVHDFETGSAAVVDPAWDAPTILDAVDKLGARVTDILLTHSHRDHVNGVDEVREASGANLHIHEAEYAFWAQKPEDITLHQDGDQVRIGATTFTWIHTPGHTPGSSCFYFPDHLITGDTLFVYGCGRCDLPGGSPESMFNALERLKGMPKKTIIHPGHNYSIQTTSTIEEEIVGNPFMHWEDLEAFTRYRLVEHERTRKSPYGPITKSDLKAAGLMQ